MHVRRLADDGVLLKWSRRDICSEKVCSRRAERGRGHTSVRGPSRGQLIRLAAAAGSGQIPQCPDGLHRSQSLMGFCASACASWTPYHAHVPAGHLPPLPHHSGPESRYGRASGTAAERHRPSSRERNEMMNPMTHIRAWPAGPLFGSSIHRGRRSGWLTH